MSMHLNDENPKRGSSYNWRRSTANPQELLLRLIEEDDEDEPNKEAIFEKWRKLLAKDDAMQRAVDSYYFINMYNYYVLRSKRSKNGSAAARTIDIEKIAEEVKQRVAQIGLFYLTLPTGQFIKDATFEQCINAQGIFGVIGKMGKPSEIVGQKLTEKQVKGALKSAGYSLS